MALNFFLQAIVLKTSVCGGSRGLCGRVGEIGKERERNLNLVTNSHSHHLFSICFVTLKIFLDEKSFFRKRKLLGGRGFGGEGKLKFFLEKWEFEDKYGKRDDGNKFKKKIKKGEH